MHPTLQPYFKQLEQQRQEFCSWVSQAPEPRQHQVPGEGQWSAAQVLYHLALVDRQVTDAIEKRLGSGKPLRPVRLGTRFRSFLLNLFLRLPLKFKAPAAVREVPDTVIVPDVIQSWQASRARLETILASLPAEQVQKEIFFHPRSGMLSMPQTLRFMVEHAQHHRRQMQRLLS